ncbi:Uncharacterised protein [Mycobacteroides abscessus subsp. abscessus]|nr:Uncharacterised protein [Mycobacteroides abscessus subsp. abscessus]
MLLARIQFIQRCGEVLKLFAELVDTVECVKDVSERKTDGDIVAVPFPIKIAANRPEEVIEIRDLIAQVIGRCDRVVKVLGLGVGSGGELFLQGVLPVQNVDRISQ